MKKLLVLCLLLAGVLTAEIVTVTTNPVSISPNPAFILGPVRWSVVNIGSEMVFVRPNVETLVISNSIPVPAGYSYTGFVSPVYSLMIATSNGTSSAVIAFE